MLLSTRGGFCHRHSARLILRRARPRSRYQRQSAGRYRYPQRCSDGKLPPWDTRYLQDLSPEWRHRLRLIKRRSVRRCRARNRADCGSRYFPALRAGRTHRKNYPWRQDACFSPLNTLIVRVTEFFSALYYLPAVDQALKNAIWVMVLHMAYTEFTAFLLRQLVYNHQKKKQA